MIGRRQLPEELRPVFGAFEAVLAEVEPAKAALTEALPTSRLPGRPLAECLDAFEGGLRRARARMATWRHPSLEEAWRACDEGLGHALELAARLRAEAPDPGGFEGLLGTIQALLDPLDPFEDAAARFDGLRQRRRRARG